VRGEGRLGEAILDGLNQGLRIFIPRTPAGAREPGARPYRAGSGSWPGA
jgi:hypothetical protein